MMRSLIATNGLSHLKESTRVEGRCVDCKHNTEGFNCERCKDGYYRPSGLSHYREDACRTCDCDLTGSVSDVCIRDDQSALSGQVRHCIQCQCKANVEGLYCDRCRPNTIHLNADNPLGCQACFCFGLTDKCREIPWATASISNNVGWHLTDLSGVREVRPEIENREVLMFNANQNKDRSLFYWKAPDTFTGNMLNSYGGNLLFYVYYVPMEQGNSIPVADLVIELSFCAFTHIFGLTLDTAVPPPEGTPVDRIEDVLHPSVPDTRMRGVEVCECPENFAGNSCESCARGYRRVNNQLYGGHCEKCSCQGHSDTCDPFTGACTNCQAENSADVVLVHAQQQKIAAPQSLVVAGPAASQEDAYVCTACERGYEGNKCEVCADGFFGNPMESNGTCKECECNGNIDLMAIGNCDSETGKCLKCIGDTTGEHCEFCKENHWGSALEHTCKPCGCHHVGAESPQCGNENGECKCKMNYIGKQCDRCVDGHGDIENGCPPCECNMIGSIGDQCDAVSGQCTCKQGVFGKEVTGLKCDACQPNHYGLGPDGCKECKKLAPAPGQVCDSVTGECVCPPNTVGEMCENCTENAWDYHPLKGCKLCECSDVGSSNGKCDMRTGQCKCRNEYVGLRCDLCTHGFFGFPSCQPCNCDPSGTDPLQCKDGLCLCNEEGECPCKKNVIGAEMRPVSTTCEQSSLQWQQTYAEDRRAVFEEPWEYYTKKHNLNLLKEYPARYNSYPTDAVPLYWPLPKSMLGDRTSSYNGFLRFKVRKS
ncbi:laminin EGF-like protein [Cooperia oncophora]